MSDENSNAGGFRFLQDRVGELTGESIKHRQKAARYRKERDELAARVAELEGQVGSVTTERDTLNQRLTAQPSDLQKQLDAAQGKLREIAHRGAFATVATSKGIEPDRHEALWKLSEYTPEGDEPDPATIAERIGATVERHASLFLPRPADAGSEPPPARKGPGAERGAPATTAAGMFTVRRSQTRDYQWMRDNAARYNAAYRDGTLKFVED